MTVPRGRCGEGGARRPGGRLSAVLPIAAAVPARSASPDDSQMPTPSGTRVNGHDVLAKVAALPVYT
ncbi:hypothetical protein [Streptomyces sp. NPDC001415]